MTKTVEPTSPSCIIIEPAGNVTGYMQSTISRICVSSKFFMKSLFNMAVLISSRDLEKKKTIIVKILSLSLFCISDDSSVVQCNSVISYYLWCYYSDVTIPVRIASL